MTSALLLALATTTGLMPASASSGFISPPTQSTAPPSSPAPAASTPAASSPSAANAGPVQVYVDFATGPDEASSALSVQPIDGSRAVGNSWFTSPAITHIFGGTPSADQQQQFKQAVIDGLNHDYAAAGLPVHFSTNPAGAARELSILSNATAAQNPNWIGVGAVNGRDAITLLDHYTFTTDERGLINALRHNGDHEIGHTLGMEHTSSDGFINSAVISPSALMGDNLAFTPDALQAIRTRAGDLESQTAGLHGQALETPEPASWLVLATLFGIGLGRRRPGRRENCSG